MADQMIVMTGRPMTKFEIRVLSVVRRIPVGRVATYGDVAALAGRPGAARAVGNIMRGCGRPDVPCHRVIAAGGRLGGYGGQRGAQAVAAGRGRISRPRQPRCRTSTASASQASRPTATGRTGSGRPEAESPDRAFGCHRENRLCQLQLRLA